MTLFYNSINDATHRANHFQPRHDPVGEAVFDGSFDCALTKSMKHAT